MGGSKKALRPAGPGVWTGPGPSRNSRDLCVGQSWAARRGVAVQVGHRAQGWLCSLRAGFREFTHEQETELTV